MKAAPRRRNRAGQPRGAPRDRAEEAGESDMERWIVPGAAAGGDPREVGRKAEGEKTPRSCLTAIAIQWSPQWHGRLVPTRRGAWPRTGGSVRRLLKACVEPERGKGCGTGAPRP